MQRRALSGRDFLLDDASWYADRGDAGLILDSFASHDVSTVCLGGEPTPLTRAFDAYHALVYWHQLLEGRGDAS